MIGRIRWDLDFDPWVRGQVPSNDNDKHVCSFVFNSGHPFLLKNKVSQPAQHIAHTCPTNLIKGIHIKTQVPERDIERQDLDTTTQGAMVPNADGTEINTWLYKPKTTTDAPAPTAVVPGKQDAWLFPMDHEFDQGVSTWSYAYEIVMAGEAYLHKREAPVWWDPSRDAYYTLENLEDLSTKFTSELPKWWITACGADNLPKISKITNHMQNWGHKCMNKLEIEMVCDGQGSRIL